MNLSNTHKSFSRADGRRFGLLVGGAFLALAIILMLRGRSTVSIGVPGVLGAMLVLLGLAIPDRLGPVYRGWMSIALLLSKITTPIVMAVIYYFIITPVALLRRGFGGAPLRARLGDEGYWAAHAPARTGSMERQF